MPGTFERINQCLAKLWLFFFFYFDMELKDLHWDRQQIELNWSDQIFDFDEIWLKVNKVWSYNCSKVFCPSGAPKNLFKHCSAFISFNHSLCYFKEGGQLAHDLQHCRESEWFPTDKPTIISTEEIISRNQRCQCLMSFEFSDVNK